MTEHRAALERLCRSFGIATEYDDIWGVRHAVRDDSLVALLAAFDVDASSETRVAGAERAAALADWQEALPPVAAIAARDVQAAIALRLPASSGLLRWTIVEEGGPTHRGEVEASVLPESGRAELDGEVRRLCRFEPGVPLIAGYHHLRIEGYAGETLLIAAPARCWRPEVLEGDGRVFGPAVQLYALRSDGNWGIGDFGDLLRVVEQWAARGAGIVGLNPLHALFAHNPAHISPYSPSSRQWLNPIYIDIEAIEELAECESAQRHVRSAAFQDRLERLRAEELVDHVGVAAAKHEVLRLLYAHFRVRHIVPGSGRAAAFRAFQSRGDEALRRFALFEALQARLHDEDASVWGWPVWPDAFRHPDSSLVQRYANDHLDEVEYHEYLQWQADCQLARAAEQGRARGMGVGLYLDLAVSVDRAGVDTWSHAATYALEASVGAPPDDFNPQGQDWGLPPLRPDRLRASGYRVVIDTFRANMRHAGALRIDHVMGLMRLFWIASGQPARDGAYVCYRADELLAIVALESHRNCCMVIGEDLGTVQDEMRRALAARGVLSYRLLHFERDGQGGFRLPPDYPRDALVAVSTHDLPTLAGWWCARDLVLRRELGHFADAAAYETQMASRANARRRLLQALHEAGCLDRHASYDTSQPMTVELATAIHAFIASSPAALMIVQLEDALGMVEQANLPGTTDEHPNWRRKLACDLDEMAASEPVAGLAATLAKLRPSSQAAAASPCVAAAGMPPAA